MTTYLDIKGAVQRLIPGVQAQLTDALYYDAICAGLDAMLPWQSLRSTQTLTGDGSDTTFTLETDLYEIDAVMDDDSGEIYPNALLSPGLYLGDNMAGDNDWIEYPKGTLSLSKAPDSGDTYTVFYRAHWDKPDADDDDDFVMTIPAYLETALAFYAAYYCMTTQSTTTSMVRQYASEVDAGNPIHNPLENTSKFLYAQFINLMNSHPRQTAGSRA